MEVCAPFIFVAGVAAGYFLPAPFILAACLLGVIAASVFARKNRSADAREAIYGLAISCALVFAIAVVFGCLASLHVWQYATIDWDAVRDGLENGHRWDVIR